jgi:regulator of sirC expression with transglutaminase-like and TPR domain
MPGTATDTLDRMAPDRTADDGGRAANRARFGRLVARPEPEIDLLAGALLIAADGRPEVAPEPTTDAIDLLTDRVRARLDRDDDTAAIERVHDVLYREVGFRGPTAAEHGEAANSLIDRVVERRIGLPISLAIVELEVGWRLGLPLAGVGLPGHFIVGGPAGALYDPAAGGRPLTRDDCQVLLRRSLGPGILFHAGMVRPVGRREILARVLRNLRVARLAERDWPSALGVIELLAVLEPTDPDHGRDRGLLLGRMGRFSEGIRLLNAYLEERPDGGDAADVAAVVEIFRGRRN